MQKRSIFAGKSRGDFVLRNIKSYNRHYNHVREDVLRPHPVLENDQGTDFGAGCVQLWIRSSEPLGEHPYEN